MNLVAMRRAKWFFPTSYALKKQQQQQRRQKRNGNIDISGYEHSRASLTTWLLCHNVISDIVSGRLNLTFVPSLCSHFQFFLSFFLPSTLFFSSLSLPSLSFFLSFFRFSFSLSFSLAPCLVVCPMFLLWRQQK